AERNGGADGVALSARPIGRSLNKRPTDTHHRASIEASPCRVRTSRHPGAPASIKVSRHPSSARRRMLLPFRRGVTTYSPACSQIIAVHTCNHLELDGLWAHRFALADIGAASEEFLFDLRHHV